DAIARVDALVGARQHQVLDLAARDADVLQLTVLQGVQHGPQSRPLAPLLKRAPTPAEEAIHAPRRVFRRSEYALGLARGHGSASRDHRFHTKMKMPKGRTCRAPCSGADLLPQVRHALAAKGAVTRCRPLRRMTGPWHAKRP